MVGGHLALGHGLGCGGGFFFGFAAGGDVFRVGGALAVLGLEDLAVALFGLFGDAGVLDCGFEAALAVAGVDHFRLRFGWMGGGRMGEKNGLVGISKINGIICCYQCALISAGTHRLVFVFTGQ